MANYRITDEVGMTQSQAVNEASKCLSCYDAPCKASCPAGVNVPKFISKIKSTNFKGAINVIRESNMLPGVCGRVCPVEELCQKNCIRQKIDESIKIGQLQRFAADACGLPEVCKVEKRQEKVAVIGGGPAGLACAYKLALKGVNVTIYESSKDPGGVLTYGIPPFRLSKKYVQTEIDFILKHNIKMETGKTFGEDIHYNDLSKKFNAVFLAVGTSRAQELDIEGKDLKGVLIGQDFLAEVNQNVVNGKTPSKPGKTVCVIGGGNVAIDAATTAKFAGAEEAVIVYRRSENEMPAWKIEREAAADMGVKFRYLTAPVRIVGEKGKVTGLECVQMKLGAPDASGRRKPIAIEDSNFVIDCDTVIQAVGQFACDCLTKQVKGLDINKDGTVKVDKHGMTSVEGLFAGGDIVNGGDTVVKAVAHGKAAAEGILKFLKID